MTTFQKIIKYCAIAFAILLIVCIIGGILSALGFIGGFFGENAVTKEMNVYTISSDIKELKIDISAADFSIISSEKFSVESNLKGLEVEENNGVLNISEKSHFGMNYNKAVLKLFIPENFVFTDADINTGAGKLTADSLSADKLFLELGAGEVNIDELNAFEKAEIDGGAGEVTISGGSLKDLSLDMGVGELNLTSAILGTNKLDYGVGETNLSLIGSKEDYEIKLDKGVGSAVIDGENMKDGSVFGDGQNRIDVDGGVGSINICFK